MDLGDDHGRCGDDWAVSADALTHALRTPLNALKGYATLLAGGELGRLDEEATAAVVEMRRAVGELEAAVELLGPVAPPPVEGAPIADLTPVLDAAFARVGYTTAADGALVLDAPAWSGWGALFAALARLCAADGALAVTAQASGGRLELRARAPRGGSGDGRLAAVAARRRAAAAGIALDLGVAGGARLEADGLICGEGRTTYRWNEVPRDADSRIGAGLSPSN